MTNHSRSGGSLRYRLHTLDFGAPADATRAVLARLGRLEVSTPARWGTMTAGGMLCHLTDAFRAVYGERLLTGADGRRATHSVRRSAIKVLALYLPVPWPKGLRTPAQVDQDREGTAPTDFERDRVVLVSFIERFAGSDLPSDIAHPYLGRLSVWEWRRWAYLHVDHHVRQFGL